MKASTAASPNVICNAKMKLFLIILICFLGNSSIGQKSSDLRSILEKKYPDNILNSEQYIFFSDIANFEKLDRPIFKKYLPNYNLYTVDLTFKRRTDWKCRCIIFFDSVTNDFIFYEPLSMNIIDKKLLDEIRDIIFKDTSSLFEFLNDFQSLRQIGSKYKFIKTNTTDTLISYDLVLFDDQDYITKPYHDTQKEVYDLTQIMGKFYIRIKENRIIDYLELGPRSKL